MKRKEDININMQKKTIRDGFTCVRCHQKLDLSQQNYYIKTVRNAICNKCFKNLANEIKRIDEYVRNLYK